MDQKSCPKTRMGIVLVLGQLWWKVLIHFKCWLLYIYTVAYIYRPNSIYTSILLYMPTMSPDVSDFKVIEVRLSLNCQTEVSCSEAMLVGAPVTFSSSVLVQHKVSRWRTPPWVHLSCFELSDFLLNVPFLSWGWLDVFEGGRGILPSWTPLTLPKFLFPSYPALLASTKVESSAWR